MAGNLFRENGVVEEVRTGTVLVRLFVDNKNEERCEHCGLCEMRKEGRFLEAVSGGIPKGARVIVEVHPPSMIRGILLLFMVPLLLFVAGAVLGEFALPLVLPGLASAHSLPSMLAAFGLMAAWYLVVYLSGARIAGKEPPKPRVVRVLDDGEADAAFEAAVFRVAGLDDAAAGRVIKELERITGISGASFDSTDKQLSIRHDHRIIGRLQLREVLVALGVEITK
jgi:positive regulator of sigma E activity